jgi:hypothetical protein
LALGINDCAILPFNVAQMIISGEHYKNIVPAQTPFLSCQLGFGVRQDATTVLSELQIKTRLLQNAGQISSILNHWAPIVQTNPANSRVSVLSIVFYAILIIIIIVLVVWIFLLQNEIEISTSEHVNEIIHKELSPIVLPVDNEFLKRIMQWSPYWIFLSNANGQTFQ